MRSFEDMPKISLPLGQEIKVSDSTIRDGSQMPGIVMTREHKIEIFEYLNKIGIDKTETFVYNERDRDACREMFDRGYELPEITAWARANPKDIDIVLKIDDIEEVGILMSVSDSHIFDKMGLKSHDDAMKKYTNTLEYAVDHGLKTRCHIEDSTRADWEFVIPLVKELVKIDTETIIRPCDTLGYGLPWPEVELPYGIPASVNALKDAGVKNIEMHVHDDFGFSMSNTIAGYWYGANWSSVTFLGIGERAGNVEMEKILLFFCTRLDSFEDRYNMHYFKEFAEWMQKEIGCRVPRNKAIVGRNIFVHESGLHTDGVIKNPFIYEPYPPELVGQERQLLVGESSGSAVIRMKIEEALIELLGVEVKVSKDDNRIKRIYDEIQSLYNNEGRRSVISDEELSSYAEEYFLFQPIVESTRHAKHDED